MYPTFPYQVMQLWSFQGRGLRVISVNMLLGHYYAQVSTALWSRGTLRIYNHNKNKNYNFHWLDMHFARPCLSALHVFM